MRLVLIDDEGDRHEVADDRRLRALVEVCAKGWSRVVETAVEEMGASVAEAAADAAGLPYAGVANPAVTGGPSGD